MIEVVLALAVALAVGWLCVIVIREALRRSAPARLEARVRALAAAREGGAPDHPIAVASSAQIEPRAEREPCPRCHGPMHIETHDVDTSTEARLRRAITRCGQCGERTATWFRVLPVQLD